MTGLAIIAILAAAAILVWLLDRLADFLERPPE